MARRHEIARRLPHILAGTALLALTCACGDIDDPVLQVAHVELNGQITQSLEMEKVETLFFNDDVDPSSTFRLVYDEPVELETVQEHVYLEDASGSRLASTISQRLADVIVTPQSALVGGQNHVLRVERGIDDAERNTTEYHYAVTFYVP